MSEICEKVSSSNSELNDHDKPDLTKFTLIAKAIKSFPRKIGTVTQICDWIAKNYPFYAKSDIRELRVKIASSMNYSPHFIRHGESGHWRINPKSRKLFVEKSETSSKRPQVFDCSINLKPILICDFCEKYAAVNRSELNSHISKCHSENFDSSDSSKEDLMPSKTKQSLNKISRKRKKPNWMKQSEFVYDDEGLGRELGSEGEIEQSSDDDTEVLEIPQNKKARIEEKSCEICSKTFIALSSYLNHKKRNGDALTAREQVTF